MKIYLLILLFLVTVTLGIYTYKLLDVPTGLTVDEAAFGYNAALLAETGKDERGIPTPVFVLSIDGKDWRQPVTQYYLAGLFKIFGPSVYLLRFSSIILAIISIVCIYILARDIIGDTWALFASFFITLTPIFMIHSHMGLDNIMPVPFTLAWLWGLFSYRKNKNLLWLVLSGVAMGINFYSYKGMRAVFPVWMVVSAIYLLTERATLKSKISSLVAITAGIAPFMAVIPYLEKNYSGAILGGANPTLNNVYDLFIPYLSSFDLSYLFIRGDATFFHSTGRHGMLLLASLPWLLIGIYSTLTSKNKELKTVLIALFSAPLLYSVVGSEHRYSRLLCLLPMYAILMSVGVKYIWERGKMWSKSMVIIGMVIALINFGDFVTYYWRTYPGVTETLLGDMDYYQDFEKLAEVSSSKSLEPIISSTVVKDSGEAGKFFQIVYFGKLLSVITDDKSAQTGQALLTQRESIEGNTKSDEPSVKYYVQYVSGK